MKKILLLLAVCCPALQATSFYGTNKSGKSRVIFANGTSASCAGIALGVFFAGSGAMGAALAENDIDRGKLEPWVERPITVSDNETATICRVKATPLQIWTNDPEIVFLGRDGIRRESVEIPSGQIHHYDIINKQDAQQMALQNIQKMTPQEAALLQQAAS